MNSVPSITRFPSLGSMMPIYSAMALAVSKLSPVTIRIVMPAILHFLMASGTSGLAISFTPMIARHISSDF